MKRFTSEQVNSFTLNVIAAYYQAKTVKPVFDVGRVWYAQAFKEALKLATEFHISIECATGVIAALSPGNKWERNIVDAWLCCQAWADNAGQTSEAIAHLFTSKSYSQNKVKAVKCLNTLDPLKVLGGNKVRAFYSCILSRGNTATVCVDGHAWYIASNTEGGLKEVPSISDSNYEDIARAYINATDYINSESLDGIYVSPAQVQAITWTYRRVIKGIDKELLSEAVTS